MAWSWSHTSEAYEYAREELLEQEREWLEVVFAEWRAAQEKHSHINPVHANFNERKYERALKWAKSLRDDLAEEVLAEFIWEKMEAQATCTNGGWEAWCCPYGCVCHMVPFSPEEEDDA